MAWKWFWNTETKYYDGEITRDTDWGGDASTGNQPVSGGRVQEWLKTNINGRYGFLNMRFNESESMYYIECFTSEDDYKKYESDKSAHENLLLQSVQIPISTIEGDTFTATLKTSLRNDADIVITDDKFEIPLNYRSIKISQIGNENANYTGTLVVERSTDGKLWSEVATIPNILVSKELNDVNTYQNVEIGSYLTQGKQLVRVRATYDYTKDDGTIRTVTSGNVVIGASVNKTRLELVLRTNYEQPIPSKDVNGNANPFSVTYGVYGSVKKTMYVRITGSTGVVTEEPLAYELGAEVDSTNKTISVAEDAAYGYMTHGIKKVEAWLECDNGLGETLKSDVLVNRFMVVNPDTPNANLTKPYLMLQNVDSEIDNFVQAEVAEYAVYSPSGEDVNVAFLLTEYAKDYESTGAPEYFRLETSVKPNTANSLLTTVEIEAENDADALDIYNTYFRVRRIVGDTSTDFMRESMGEASYLVQVDNTNAFTPVTGATFLLNPKVRNNNEENPLRILNAKNNNAEVESVWTNADLINGMWVTASDGQKVLRIMAGSTLEIKKNVWSQFLTNPNSSLTFEIDCKVSNVTNTTDPIISMFSGSVNDFKGLKMNALEGWLMNGSNRTKNDCLFAWDEDVRTHFSFNLNHQVTPNKGDVRYSAEDASKANGSFALARVLVNGDCVREMKYSTTDVEEWGATQNSSIIIGNSGADIDIYSIRMYEGKQLEMVDIMNRNYKASLPTAAAKVELDRKNNLLEGGRISLEKSKNAGLNCMVWHGVLPYKNDSSEQTGWYEYFRYDEYGNYLPELSGTNCKATKSLSVKGQGSTAKTYYDWNQQDDNSKIKATIQVALGDFHESINVRVEGNVAYIKGGNLGKNFPLEETEVEYPYSNGMVTVPDGWIDGNGKYRGMGYMVAEGTSLAQKKVIKINYASSMQSHLIGACTTYDLLHRKVVGATPLQQNVPTAVSAKHMEPFMLFNEDGGATYFKGMGTYGAGKADKASWGFVKKKMPMYALIEGSDNNYPMTGFRVPFDKNTAVYSCEDEGWLYNGQQSWDFDLGNTFDLEGSTDEDGYSYMMSDKYKEAPTKLVRDKWADIHNFIYLHSSNLKYYDGTFAQFKNSKEAEDVNFKYWCTADSNLYLYRYDYINKEWIHSGLLNRDTYKQVSLKSDVMTAKAYTTWVNGGTGDYDALNEAFIAARVAHMRKYLKFFFNEKSLQFCYCYVLGLMAGTDNSDKNTYYKIDPYAVSIPQDNDFASWFANQYGKSFDFSAIHQVEMDGDDMDSILRTNNNSHQTKPYYIDRLHPYADDNPNECLYEGMNNQLFNFVERAYEGTHELSAVMNELMIAATELITDEDVKNGLVGGKSLWGFFNKYFFNVQRYFPQIAYLEQARIRYEFPELLGYISSGGGARSIRPITQSLGSQLQNELQYVNQRVIYMTSYAGFGAWGGDTTHSIGLADANETFGFMPAALPDGSAASYTFTIKPHQYIYPSFYEGQTFTQTHKRTSPKETCTFSFTQSYTSGDTGVGICGVNYISDLGNLTNMSITTALIIGGKRLTNVQSTYNGGCFRPSSITLNALNIRELYLEPRGVNISLDCSGLIRMSSLIASWNVSSIIVPESSNLKKIHFSNSMKKLKLENVPNLETYTFVPSIRYGNFIEFYIGKNVGTNTGLSFKNEVFALYQNQINSGNKLQSIHVENIDWDNFDAEALAWLADRPTCELYGRIGIAEGSNEYQTAVTWDMKNKFIKKFGDIDTGNGDLTLEYRKRNFEASTAKIKGNFFVDDYIVRDKGYNDVETFDFSVTPESTYMNTQTKIQFSLEGGNTSAYSMSADGKLSVNVYQLSDKQNFATIKAAVTQYENGSFVTENVTKKIEIWLRPAQLGDVVYYDGSYSSVDEYDSIEKTVVGVCCYVAPRYTDTTSEHNRGDIVDELFDPNDIMQRLMVSVDYVGSQKTYEGRTTVVWQGGVYTFNSSQKTDDLHTTKADGTIQPARMNGKDLAVIEPLIEYREFGTTGDAISDSTFRSESSELEILNNGFVVKPATYVAFDSLAYGEPSDYKNRRTLQNSDSEWYACVSDYYKRFANGVNMVHSSYAAMLKIIAHRNSIIRGEGTSYIDNFKDENGVPMYIGLFKPSTENRTSTSDNVADSVISVWSYFKETYGETNWFKWGQLLFPVFSAAYEYEPSVKKNDVLLDKFKANNWFLPSGHIMARFYWYKSKGNDSTQNIFSKAIKKGVMKEFANSGYHAIPVRFMWHTWYQVNFGNGKSGMTGRYETFQCRPICAF